MPYPKKDGIPVCRKAGIEKITNLANNKLYIGSSESLYSRMRTHRNLLRRNAHQNRYLQHAWNKYGEKAFQFDVQETCEPGVRLAREQYWIDTLDVTNHDKGYNIAKIAGAPMAGRKHSDETKAKLRGRIMSLEQRAKISEANKNREFTEETKKHLRENHWSKGGTSAAEVGNKISAGLTGYVMTEERKANISAGKVGKKMSNKGRAAQAAYYARKKAEREAGIIQPKRKISAETREKMSRARRIYNMKKKMQDFAHS